MTKSIETQIKKLEDKFCNCGGKLSFKKYIGQSVIQETISSRNLYKCKQCGGEQAFDDKWE